MRNFDSLACHTDGCIFYGKDEENRVVDGKERDGRRIWKEVIGGIS